MHRVVKLPGLSRRDQQKASTRAALTEAAIELAEVQGVDHTTVDAVADRVGVSRRTFFNYFPNVDACIATSTSELLAAAMAALEERPADEPILQSAAHAFRAVFPAEAIGDLVRLFRLLQSSPRLAGTHLEYWHGANRRVERVLAARLPHADDLWVRSLAGAILGVAESAVTAWLTTLDDHTPEAITQEADAWAEALHGAIATCFGHLADGFGHPTS